MAPKKEPSSKPVTTMNRENPKEFPRDFQLPAGEFLRLFHENLKEYGLKDLIVVKLWKKKHVLPDTLPLPGSVLDTQAVSVEHSSISDSTSQLSVDDDESKKESEEFHKLYVELEQMDQGDSICQIVIKDWKVDSRILDILANCCSVLEKLHTLSLYNAGLNGAMLEHLVSFLNLYSGINRLNLDCNPIPEENFFILIQENASLQYLTLKCCDITDDGASYIADALGGISSTNYTLSVLNLSGNSITCKGAESLAKALRVNRTLLSLSLAGNKIGDAGAKAFAAILMPSPLRVEEQVHRRLLLYEKWVTNCFQSLQTLPEVIADDLDKDTKKIKRDKKEKLSDSDRRNDEKKKGKKDVSVGYKGKLEKSSSKEYLRSDSAFKQRSDIDKSRIDLSTTLLASTDSTLITKVKYDTAQKKLMLQPNFSLINLNLALNTITINGVRELLQAWSYQQSTTPAEKENATGIMRILLQGNCINQDDPICEEIQKLSESMDPFKMYMQTSQNPSKYDEEG